MPAVGCDGWPLLAPWRPNAVFPHEAGDLLAGDADALGLQFGMDARSPIAPTAVPENTSDLANEVSFGAAHLVLDQTEHGGTMYANETS